MLSLQKSGVDGVSHPVYVLADRCSCQWEGRKREMGGKGKGSGEGMRSLTNGKWHACFHTPQIKLCSQPLQSAIFCLSQFCIVDCPISPEIK